MDSPLEGRARFSLAGRRRRKASGERTSEVNEDQGAPTDRGPGATPAWVPLSLLVIGFAMLWPYRHFAGDDAYITFRFVKNLSEGQGYAFNPGQPTNGSTAPLWVFLIAGAHRLGLSINDAAHLLNGGFALLAIFAFWKLTGLYERRWWLRWAAVFLLVVNPWFVRWGMSGMENDLALALWIGAVYFQVRSRQRLNWLSPLLAGLGTLTRPEMGVFTGLLFLDTLLHAPDRKGQRIVVGGLVFAAVVAPWFWYAHATFGSVVPNTVTAKISRNYHDAFVKTGMFFASFWAFQALAVLLAVLLAVGLGRRALRQRALLPAERQRWFLPLAWALVLPAFYLVGGAPVSGRYLELVLPPYLLVGMRAWSYLFDQPAGLRRLGRATIGASALATLALVGYVNYRYCWFITGWPEGMDPRMISLARSLRDHSKPGDVVAADQIGVLGYFSERQVLDLDALVSPEVLPYRKSTVPNALWRYVADQQPQYLFLVDDVPLLTSRDPRFATIQLLSEAPIQREGAGGADRPAIYRLYRTDWRSSAAR